MHTVYVLFSSKLNKQYVGSSERPYERLQEHNKGRAAFTSRGIPWDLKYIEYYETRKESRARERFLKTGAGRIFLKLLFNEVDGYPEKEIPENCLKYEIL